MLCTVYSKTVYSSGYIVSICGSIASPLLVNGGDWINTSRPGRKLIRPRDSADAVQIFLWSLFSDFGRLRFLGFVQAFSPHENTTTTRRRNNQHYYLLPRTLQTTYNSSSYKYNSSVVIFN